jgi:hypothetical protein
VRRPRLIGLAPLLLAAIAAAVGCSYGNESNNLPPLRWIDSAPRPGTREVALDISVDLLFSMPIAAEALGTGAVRLVSGTTIVPADPVVDLLERRIRLTPRQPLRPELRHHVVIASGLPGLDGSTLARTSSFDFTTGRQLRGSTPAPPSPRAAELQPIWSARCVHCHGGHRPRAGLDLSSPRAASLGLVDVPSSESPLRRVTSGDHATSYLMRKLLGRFAITGLPMPPDGSPLTPEQLRRIASWIDGGALP